MSFDSIPSLFRFSVPLARRALVIVDLYPFFFRFYKEDGAQNNDTFVEKSSLVSNRYCPDRGRGDGRFEVNSMSGLAYVRVDDYPFPIDDNCP